MTDNVPVEYALAGVMLLVALALGLLTLAVGRFLGPTRRPQEKNPPPEHGGRTGHKTWVQFRLRYAVLALLFVSFDMERVFMGPNTLLAALKTDAYWCDQPLPSRAQIARLLKQTGLTRRYQPHHDLLQLARTEPRTPHQEWQMDAQGIMRVGGVGKVGLINLVDVVSRVKYDNTTPSPFPTRLHLWLIALGVQVRFTRKRCPTDHAIIERTHQTMTAQALLGQTYPSHAALWAGLDERRQVLNHHLPSRALAHQAPLEAYPGAIHSGRSYRPEWEEEFLSLEKVSTYLAQGRWFRSVRTNGSFGLGSYQYYLGKHFARCGGVAIRFDPDTTALICQPEGSEETIRLPAQGLTKAELMGELAVLQALPIYQLALPFSLEAWRQLEYVSERA